MALFLPNEHSVKRRRPTPGIVPSPAGAGLWIQTPPDQTVVITDDDFAALYHTLAFGVFDAVSNANYDSSSFVQPGFFSQPPQPPLTPLQNPLKRRRSVVNNGIPGLSSSTTPAAWLEKPSTEQWPVPTSAAPDTCTANLTGADAGNSLLAYSAAALAQGSGLCPSPNESLPLGSV